METKYGEYIIQNLTEVNEDLIPKTTTENAGRNLLGLLPMFILIVLVVLRISWTIFRSFGQKTRSPQQRRMYVGSHPRHSLGTQEPTIYVSPSNLPPPPKYEFMAPPSYEEVVGVHYPQFAAQPITQPITTALQGPSQPVATSLQEPRHDNATSVTVVSEARTSVTVART